MQLRVISFVLVALAACQSSSRGVDGATPLSSDGANHGVKPNIVFVMADDLDVGVYDQMPRLKQLMDDQGTRFAAHYVNISLCCPSRAAILRGQYAHNNLIYTNAPPTGGFETFYANGEESETIPVWMADAGYRTVLIGKYLNGYPNTAPPDYIPRGWSEWYSPVGGYPYVGTNYTMDENGIEVRYGRATTDYMTDVIARKSVDFIDRAAAAHQPFFMYIAPFSPHAPAIPPLRYAHDFPDAQAPRTASFNEADVSDKPSWMQNNPLLTATDITDMDTLYRLRLRSMEGVEDLVQSIVDELTATGQLGNTYIFFTSDNGFHQGQHRFPSGKDLEFDEDLAVPLSVRGPGVPAGQVSQYPTMNVDFAPTFVDLAGEPIPAGVDGRSLVPLLGSTPPATWRRSVLLEHGREYKSTEARAPIGTMEPTDWEFPHPELVGLTPAPTRINPPPFRGVRTDRYTYVMYQDGSQELYDHIADPDQLTNIATTADPGLLAKLAGIVSSMERCTGDACRQAELAGD